jgi:D-alanyl-D-alanine carboxypeptidase (penicillin-binding protein 5/6)
MTRSALSAVALLTLFAPPVAAQPKAKPRERLDGPPVVSAKAWIVVDAKTGKKVAGGNEAEARPMASTSKIMTAWIVLRLAADDAKVLDEVVTFSERADKTPGSSAKVNAGEKLPVKELLYGLLLPSGNDAATALAEHFGPRFGQSSDGDPEKRFVAEMNRRAKSLGLKELSYQDPHGLSPKNVSSARDLAALAIEAMKDERFRSYVSTRAREYEVTTPDGGKRKVTWANTNQLLGIEGYDGIKTGTTTPAGNCLVATGEHGGDRLVVVVLGSTSADGRYVDARNLFRWAWSERARKEEPKGK